jgi:ubiquinone/menaquinone biosynthesis C-methylase UbiE
MTLSPDSSWAEIYDLAFSYMNAGIPFYVEEAIRAGGPVLELGCGTGRVTAAIAEAGVDIVGVEASAELLDAAIEKVQ